MADMILAIKNGRSFTATGPFLFTMLRADVVGIAIREESFIDV
jgi:hypothetical protein